MKTFSQKPKDIPAGSTGKYEALNLKENPFPGTPYVNRNNSDDRYNGKIYEIKIREKEHKQVLDNFLKVSQADANHIRLGYILDNSYVGRGNGKSAFTLNLLGEINKNFCLDISKGLNKCFGVQIVPEPSGRTKTFASFVDLLFFEIYEKDLIKYSLASLRYQAIEEHYPNLKIEKEFKTDAEFTANLNSPEWFESKGIDHSLLLNEILSKEQFTRVSEGFPLQARNNLFAGYRITTQEDFKEFYLRLKEKDRTRFVFNDLVLLFLASGFNGAYIIIDDFERIPDFQSEKLKQEFALEIRSNFFDGYIENAKIGFYNMILVLHAGVPRLIEKAWSVSGMERRSPIFASGVSKHIIKFDKLSVEHAYLLLSKYLSQYRIKPAKDDLHPFSKEAVALIGEKSDMNAAAILEKAYSMIELAVKEQVKNISYDFVKKNLGKKEEVIEGESKDVSDEDSTDLMKKATKKK